MATTTTPSSSRVMTWEAFEKLPDSDGMHRELLEGELQVLPPPKFLHTRIAQHVLEALLPLKARGLGQVFAEAGCKLTGDPPSWVQPDVCFLTADRVRATEGQDYIQGAPDLAVEVISPSESAADVEHKLKLLLAAGAQAVWLIYPESRRVHVFLPDGTGAIRTMGDTLSAPFLLAGWSFPVASLFED